MTDEIITTIEKNKTENIVIAPTMYKGVDYIDLRVYCLDGDTEEFHPTKKGLTFKKELIPKIVLGIEKAYNAEHVGFYGDIYISSSEKIFIKRLIEYNIHFVDVRIYWLGENPYPGGSLTWLYTKKGIRFRKELASNIIDGLEAAWGGKIDTNQYEVR